MSFTINHTEETKTKISQNNAKYWLGKTRSEETRKKISDGRRGITANEKHHLWKGDTASYAAKHMWIKRKLGKPQKCENCGTKDSPQFEWANLSGEYKRDISDWARLCKRCHQLIDQGTLRWSKVK